MEKPMHIFNNQTSKSQPTCSYCRSEDHNASSCPHVAEDHKWWSQLIVPSRDPNNWTHNAPKNKWGSSMGSFYQAPYNWGKWYNECVTVYQKQQTKVAPKAKKPKTQSKCGFCGSTDHNRKSCSQLENIKSRLITQNTLWRQRFYNKVVAEMGISDGAILQLDKKTYNNTVKETLMGIVTSINWKELSMFCMDKALKTSKYRLDYQYKQRLTVECLVNGQKQTVSLWSDDEDLSDKFGIIVNQSNAYWSSPYLKNVIGRSETPMPIEWINDGHAELVDWLVGKRSLAQLKQYGVIQHLEDLEKLQK